MTIGAVVITRNDGYGGDQPRKLLYCLTSLLQTMDEVILVDWNSREDDAALWNLVEPPKTGRLRHIVIPPTLATELVQRASGILPEDPSRENCRQDAGSTLRGVQACVEVLARNIGIRRLDTDWIVSTNQDIICPFRMPIELALETSRYSQHTLHVIARREVHLADVPRVFAHPPGSDPLQRFLNAHAHDFDGHHPDAQGVPTNFGQHADGSPLGPRDPWSLITCPGDFQLAHRNVWQAVRGFEESLVRRGYTDSNLNRKVMDLGAPFECRLVRDIPVFHLCHYPNTGSTGGAYGEWNDGETSLFNFPGTTNPETWGFADREFPEERL